MKKILLVGNLNETLESIHQCLGDFYQVQLCSEKADSVSGMMRLTKADMIIVSQIGLDGQDEEIFQLLSSEYGKIPVMVIATEDRKKSIEQLSTDKRRVEVLFRPITKQMLLKACGILLKELEPEEKKENNPDSPLEKKNVMVVDDNAILLRNIKEMLQSQYNVILAKSGEQAFSLIPKKQPDIILLDYEMPGWDGRKTLEMIREDDYAKNIPVIFLTSVADRKHIYEVLKLTPYGYILKPPSEERILKDIEKALNGEYYV